MKSFTFAAMLLCALSLSSFTVYPDGDNPTKTEGTNVVQYRIELCAFKKSIPVKTAQLLTEIGGVMPVRSHGTSVYYSSPYATEKDALLDLGKFQQMGFEGAKQVVQYNGKFITLEEYHRINNSDSNVRIWK